MITAEGLTPPTTAPPSHIVMLNRMTIVKSVQCTQHAKKGTHEGVMEHFQICAAAIRNAAPRTLKGGGKSRPKFH
jgi:ribosomal protein S14